MHGRPCACGTRLGDCVAGDIPLAKRPEKPAWRQWVGVATTLARATIAAFWQILNAPPDHRRNSQPEHLRKDGRVVECAGLEIRFTGLPVTRVRIPLFPPNHTTCKKPLQTCKGFLFKGIAAPMLAGARLALLHGFVGAPVSIRADTCFSKATQTPPS